MGVQVTLAFTSLDEAIVALGKMVTAGAPLRATVPVEKAPRAGRSDKGQPRGPYKKDEPNAGAGTTASSAPATNGTGATAATSAPAEGSPVASTAAAPAPAPKVAAVPTLEQVQAAVEKLYAAKDFDGTLAVLSRYGVQRGKDIAPESRADFIAKVDRVLAGEAI